MNSLSVDPLFFNLISKFNFIIREIVFYNASFFQVIIQPLISQIKAVDESIKLKLINSIFMIHNI